MMIRTPSLIVALRPTATRACHRNHRRDTMGWRVAGTKRTSGTTYASRPATWWGERGTSSSHSSSPPAPRFQRRSTLPLSPHAHRASSHRRRSTGTTKRDGDHDVVDESATLLATWTMGTNGRGEELYALAMEAAHRAEEVVKRREERLIREQYDAAYDRRRRRDVRGEGEGVKGGDAREPNTRNGADRAAGIAVVRTIVEQARAERGGIADDVRVDRWKSGPLRRKRPDVVDALHPPPPPTDDYDDSARDIVDGGSDRRRRMPEGRDEDEIYWRKTARERMEESALRYGHGYALVRLGNDALERAGGDGRGSGDGRIPSIFLIVDRETLDGWIDESPVTRLSTILEVANAAVAHDGGDDDVSKKYLRLARELYAEAGERGSAEGYYNLGHLLWDGCEYDEAMEAFHGALEMGDSDATYFVAAQYLSYEEDGGDNGGLERGRHFLRVSYERYGPVSATTPQSTASTATTMPSLTNDVQRHGYALLLHAAHHHGHGPALHHLALLFNQHGDAAEFRRLLSEAADAGNADSLFLRGHCRYYGTDGHDRDVSMAMGDFLASAEGGNVDAMVSAGAMLHRGVRDDDGKTIVVERDQRGAFELYQRAGESGSLEGWRNVVSCYATGQGVPKCIETAKYIANTMLRDDKG